MKTLILLLGVEACSICGKAQSTFEKYYQTGGFMSLNEQSNGNLITGIAGISVIDHDGNIIHAHYYNIVPIHMINIQSIRRLSDSVFYFSAGLAVDTGEVGQLTGGNPVIGKMDSFGHILTMHNYQLNGSSIFNWAMDLRVIAGGGAIAWGGPESFFVLRVDSTGTPLWSKQFPYSGHFRFIQELPGGDFLAGFNMDTAGACVARLDANGNFLWCKSYVRPSGFVMRCLVESDSSFIILGNTDHFTGQTPPPGYHPKLFMMQLNGMGEVQWCKGYSHPTYQWDGSVAVDRLPDRNYAVLSTLGARPFLMKTDAIGDSLWTRSAGVNGVAYGTDNLLVSTDGGIYFNGVADGNWGDGSGGIFLFKADSLGHLPCSEAIPPPITITELFPVDSSFILTYLEGAMAFPFAVGDANGAPWVTYDGCTITSVQSALPPGLTKPSIHPNPNTGHFTVQFPDPLAADSFYSVYDAVGKLLFQRPLAKRQESEEMDLSRFGSGTYLVRITSKDGVCNERVVVQ